MEHINANCPCCGSADFEVMYLKRDNLFILQGLPDETNILSCSNCDAAYAHPMPTPSQLDRIYDSDFEYALDYRKSELKGQLKYIKQLQKLLHQDSGRLLDVGCATGLLLYLADSNGWRAFGCDISDKLLEIARIKVPQASLFLGPIESANYESNYFDAVIAVNLLEHLIDPVKLLQEVNRVLRPGGLFLFKTVRIDSILARKRKANWDHLKWPGHLIWYSKNSLELVLRSANFRIKKLQVTGVPYIPGVKRYMDERVYENTPCASNDAVKNKPLKTSRPLMKRILKAILNNGPLRSCCAHVNDVFQLGDTVTVFAEKI